jgi:hypothetical protein
VANLSGVSKHEKGLCPPLKKARQGEKRCNKNDDVLWRNMGFLPAIKGAKGTNPSHGENHSLIILSHGWCIGKKAFWPDLRRTGLRGSFFTNEDVSKWKNCENPPPPRIASYKMCAWKHLI